MTKKVRASILVRARMRFTTGGVVEAGSEPKDVEAGETVSKRKMTILSSELWESSSQGGEVRLGAEGEIGVRLNEAGVRRGRGAHQLKSWL